MQIASLAGMYGADASTSPRTASLAPVNPSAGLSTAGAATMTPGATTSPAIANAAPVNVISLLPASISSTSVLGMPLAWWAAIALLLFVLKWASEHGSEAGEFKSIRIGGYNFLVITIVAILGQTIAKMLAGKYRVAALSDLILAA